MTTARKRVPSKTVAGLALAGALCGADRTVLTPAGAAKPVGPYSPALGVGDYVYVSGQGALDSAGKMPDGLEARTALTLDNVRANLAAAGLDFRHVVAVQLYVADFSTISVVEKLWKKAVPGPGPAMVRLGVAKMPVGTTVEITVVAVKDASAARRERAGVRVGSRLYLDAVYGVTRAEVEKKLKAAAGGAEIVTAYWYSTAAARDGVLPVTALPGQAKWAAFAVAATAPQTPTVYCGVVEGSAGDVEAQTREAFGKLKSCLERQGAGLNDLVATNVYLDDIGDFARMNAVYATMFSGSFPTRTTIQPGPKAGGPLVRISGVAVR